ncbi:hypothetical protein F4782DRAFT_510905 [Xylaria castorea]|nr:hypothetical protein F4782DRAFT_510905 [Xylaria castorea]
MRRIRLSTPQDGALSSYETSEERSFTANRRGLDIISKKGALRHDNASKGQDEAPTASAACFEPHETKRGRVVRDQPVRAVLLGRAPSHGILLPRTGRPPRGRGMYTRSNSSPHGIGANGGREPHARGGSRWQAKTLIFERGAQNARRERVGRLCRCGDAATKFCSCAEPCRLGEESGSRGAAKYRTLSSVADFDDMFNGAMENATNYCF